MKLVVMPLAVAFAVTAIGVHAQQALPVKAVEPSITVSLTVRGPEAKSYLTIQATSADVRDVLKEIAKKAGVTLYMSSSATGTFSGTFESIAPDTAIASVAASAGCKVLRIVLPKGSPMITADASAKVYEAFGLLPEAAVVRDVASKKSVVASAGGSADPAEAQVIYYVQGKLTPDQEQAGSAKRAAARTVAGAKTDPITGAVQAFQKMPMQDRIQAMRDMQRQMMQSMTPDERQQMFQSFGGRGGGGRGRNDHGPGGG